MGLGLGDRSKGCQYPWLCVHSSSLPKASHFDCSRWSENVECKCVFLDAAEINIHKLQKHAWGGFSLHDSLQLLTLFTNQVWLGFSLKRSDSLTRGPPGAVLFFFFSIVIDKKTSPENSQLEVVVSKLCFLFYLLSCICFFNPLYWSWVGGRGDWMEDKHCSESGICGLVLRERNK